MLLNQNNKELHNMDKKPIIIEQKISAPIDRVWKAITDNKEMEHWYFEIDEFKPEVGYIFTFYAGGEEEKYLHVCKILEIVPKVTLSYSWRYEDFDGYSVVTFELFNEGNKTRVKLIHEGTESFPQDRPDFSRASFTQGWKEIIGIYLKEYVETNRH